MAAQANRTRAPRAPGDELAAYLNKSASSAVQNRFREGVRAVQAADSVSAAERVPPDSDPRGGQAFMQVQSLGHILRSAGSAFVSDDFASDGAGPVAALEDT